MHFKLQKKVDGKPRNLIHKCSMKKLVWEINRIFLQRECVGLDNVCMFFALVAMDAIRTVLLRYLLLFWRSHTLYSTMSRKFLYHANFLFQLTFSSEAASWARLEDIGWGDWGKGNTPSAPSSSLLGVLCGGERSRESLVDERQSDSFRW